jgi:branched-chain amino acid transport system permease protein
VEEPTAIFGFTIPGIPGMRMVILSLALLLVIIFCRRGLMGRREFSWAACGGIIGRFWSKALGKTTTPDPG